MRGEHRQCGKKENAGEHAFSKAEFPALAPARILSWLAEGTTFSLGVPFSLSGARNANFAWFKEKVLEVLIIVSTVLLYLHEFLLFSGSARA